MVTREKKMQRYFKDAIRLLLRTNCPFEEMNCTMEVPVPLQRQKGFLADMQLSLLEDT